MKQKLRILEKKKHRIERLNFDYTPSADAYNFHASLARFRFLIWGIKGGKTLAGASETVRGVLGSKPRSLSWVVAPTYSHLDEAERAILEILYSFPGMIKRRNRNKRELLLKGDRILQCKSADNPDNLRGPNIDGIAWFDEAAFGKEEAHYILRERVAATGAPIIYTTTPRGRNWLWKEVQIGGMPPDQPYGEFFADTVDGGSFVSHRPTWHFPWVPKSEVEALKSRMPKIVFEQELGAQFITKESQIFHHIEERMSMELPLVSSDAGTIMGVDLARYQDWTAIVIMTPGGRVCYVDRWNDTEWTIQRPRILRLAKKWNAVIVLDKANVGSVIEEDLRNEGAEVFAIEMNSPAVKADLIQSLQLAFETGAISIPDPKAEWANEHTLQLYRELSWYEGGITTGGRMTYSAPKGLTDDCVPAGTLIRVRGGIKPIEQIQEGEEVLTHQGRFRRVVRTGARFASIIYQIRATGRPDILLTGNHRFLACRQGIDTKSRKNTTTYGEPDWCCLEDNVNFLKFGMLSRPPIRTRNVKSVDLLKFAPKTYCEEDGQLVAWQHHRGDRPNPKQNRIPRLLSVDQDLCLLLGYYFAEGSCGRHSISFASHEREAVIRSWLIEYLRRLGLRPRSRQTTKRGWSVSAGSIPLRSFFRANFGARHQKRFPEWVCFLPPEKQRFVLMGYLMGDASFEDGHIRANTISAVGAFQIHEMFMRLKIPASIRLAHRHAPKRGYMKHRQWTVSLGRPASAQVRLWFDECAYPFLESKIDGDFIYPPGADFTQLRFRDDFLVGKIRGVQMRDHNDLVYNLDVAEDHSYVANGLIVHNCVIGLALANWGRARAVAVGVDGAEVAISAEDFERILDEPDDEDENEEVEGFQDQGKDGMAKRFKTKEPRLPVFKSVFSRGRSILGFESMNRSLWDEQPWE